jgi:hypothetical protein
LAPPAPNELMPARSRPPGTAGCHSIGPVGSTNGVAARSISGLGVPPWRDGAMVRWRSCSSTLVRPAMPAADSRWPMLALSAPTAQLERSFPPSASARPVISIGSPSAVPVPCAST